MNNKESRNFLLIVLGDICRSPRINNHAQEILKKKNNNVTIFSYKSHKLPLNLTSEKVKILEFSERLLNFIKIFPSFLYYFLRIYIEIFQLIFFLYKTRNSSYDFILIQNPPCFYILPIIFLYKKFFKSQLIVDCHNFGYTLLSTKNKLIVTFYKFFEIFFLRLCSDLVFCVSENMKKVLKNKWHFKKISVLYDRPNKTKFKKLSNLEKYNFLNKFTEFKTSKNTNIFFTKKNDKFIKIENSPILLLSNSSYSIDDDFNKLLTALKLYEESKNKKNIILIMSGSGPNKKDWSRKFLSQNFKKIKIYFKWFTDEDYPLICGSVDFGISLHNSKSKVDLPIKILDVFACETPAIVYYYSDTIDELVKDKVNGVFFRSDKELFDILEKIVDGKINIKRRFNLGNWKEEWENKVGRFF